MTSNQQTFIELCCMHGTLLGTLNSTINETCFPQLKELTPQIQHILGPLFQVDSSYAMSALF